ncbi:hypothetical protein, partial [Amycolatopsis dongchuanensis]|uniref:hypothetical protein n=1 Tax=Amycolatopsis dongchuanensis TaxID=1070866 RepID=UPI0031F7A137
HYWRPAGSGRNYTLDREEPRYCYPGNDARGSACWTILDDFTGYFELWSDFGTIDSTYGQVEYAAEYTLVGSNFTVKPISYGATFDADNVTFEGDAIDACGGQRGSEIPNSYALHPVGSVPANTGVFWDPNGYTNYNGDNACKSMVIQWSFTVPGASDVTYYLYAKSPVAWSLGDDPLYRFHTAQPNDLPADPLGGR